MDFELPEELRMMQDTLRRFIDNEVIPIERDAYEGHEMKPEARAKLTKRAQELGFWQIEVPEEYGGMGLGALARIVLWEQTGRTIAFPRRKQSIFGRDVSPILLEPLPFPHAHRLVTVRYEEPKPFQIVGNKLARQCPDKVTGEIVLVDLLDAIVDRAADILERIGMDVDTVSHDIFEPESERNSAHYKAILTSIGRRGDLTSKVRESLVSIGRLLLFLANEAEGMRWSKDTRALLNSMQRDVQSLSDHATYLTNKITFLLDAIVGVVTIEQNNIIKIFSVAAVALLPPTLIASIYGMNFKHMPELDWQYGYPLAIALMIGGAVLPYLFFKWKKWL